MKIKVEYNKGENGTIDMVKFRDGLINCGGWTLPF